MKASLSHQPTVNPVMQNNLQQLSQEVCLQFNDYLTQRDLWLEGNHPSMTDEEKTTYGLHQYDNARVRELVYKELDLRSSQFIKEWFLAKRTEGFNNFVISVGSFGSTKQQAPNFANNSKTAILNIDPGFTPEEFISSSPETITKMKAHFNSTSAIMPLFYEAIKSEISTSLSTNNNVVIMDFRSPVGFKDFLGIISDFKENLGNNLAYIQGYCDSKTVAVFNANFFNSTEEIKEEISKKVISLDDLVNQNNKKWPSIKNNIVAEWNIKPELNKYGKFYTSLERIESIDNIFSKEIPINLVNSTGYQALIPSSVPTITPTLSNGYTHHIQNLPTSFPTR